MALTLYRCDQCGQTDDHPKVHYASGETFHHDCLSFDREDALVKSAPLAAEVISAAKSGIHGDQLREHILALHQGEQA